METLFYIHPYPFYPKDEKANMPLLQLLDACSLTQSSTGILP